MVKKILFAAAFLVGAFAAAVSTRPSQYRVARTATINAPPEAVFALINDFHRWSVWSPWEKLDPNMKKTFSGAESGKGSQYAWVGNSDVGEGRMTILDSTPAERVLIQLEFLKPFESTSRTVFQLLPAGQGTSVTWDMTGENNFVAKAFSMFMDMDKMVGGDFEKGLAQMKAAAENAPKQ